MTEFLIVLNISLTTFGQMLLKKASIDGGIRNLYLWSGYFLFVIVLGLSLLLMKLIELKYFTVIMSINYITVYASSVYLFNEKVSKTKAFALLFIIFGIVLFNY